MHICMQTVMLLDIHNPSWSSTNNCRSQNKDGKFNNNVGIQNQKFVMLELHKDNV